MTFRSSTNFRPFRHRLTPNGFMRLCAAFFIAAGIGLLAIERPVAAQAEKSQKPNDTDQGSGFDQFKKKLSEWQEITVELNTLRQEFYYARTREESEEVRNKYIETRAAGYAVIKDMKKAAMLAYKSNPDNSADYYKFLRRSLKEELEVSENQTLAFEIAQALNSQKVTDPELARQIGTAFFMNDRFDSAEKLLQVASLASAQAQESVKEFVNLIPRLKNFMVEEQKKRARDKEANLPQVTFETSKGTFVVELFEDDAPNTVKNFVKLVNEGFYNDKEFFNVQPMKFAATGLGGATGAPGYALPNEGLDPKKRRGNFRGTLGLPALGDDSTKVSGGIFVITFGPYGPANTNAFCNFGRVIKGMEVVDSLNRSLDKDGKEIEKFRADKIIKATASRLRDTEYVPKTVEN